MLVRMRYIAVRMFMAVHMCMLVAMKMGMLVLSFHLSASGMVMVTDDRFS